MAKGARPGRTLVVFFLILAVTYGLVALTGNWKPRLGLDLQGGTRITLIATGKGVTEKKLGEAAGIIDQRVNGSGVSESEVTTQGNQFIVVEIPGQSRRDLVSVVERQAQLRFRLVALVDASAVQAPPASGMPWASATPAGKPSASSSASTSPSMAPSSNAGRTPSRKPKTTPRNRPPYHWADKPKPTPTKGTKTPKPSSAPPQSGPSSAAPSGQPSPAPTPNDSSVEAQLAWMANPDQASVQKFNKYTCPRTGQPDKLVVDDPDKPLVTCDAQGVKYLLSRSLIEGTELQTASAGIPQNELNWVVTLSLKDRGAETLYALSKAMVGSDQQFAIALDGYVIEAAGFSGVIANGDAQISGGFSEQSANNLANSLKFGALPIAFKPDPSVETVGPSLAGNQLSAGVTAGLIGLILVMLYCLVYYRGLGVVVIMSLFVAAALTYSLVMLLSETAGFTLTLPGIAGLIVAVGITADSFVVFFERIRDEMRDGKSMRVAVEAGWKRARNTCLAADTVSLLAAVVLYFFAAGVVKGFAFALGLSTLIDLAVFFWFTKPMVSWLATHRFFNQGHRLSGLHRDSLGLHPIGEGGTV